MLEKNLCRVRFKKSMVLNKNMIINKKIYIMSCSLNFYVHVLCYRNL